jgi:hypothetical protein
MTRSELKNRINSLRQRGITADMIADPLIRSMERISERAFKRFRADLVALHEDQKLNDDQRERGVDAARRRRDVTLKKIRPLEERFEAEVRIPLLLSLGVLRKPQSNTSKRRSKQA